MNKETKTALLKYTISLILRGYTEEKDIEVDQIPSLLREIADNYEEARDREELHDELL
jgi:hypothetical protein